MPSSTNAQLLKLGITSLSKLKAALEGLVDRGDVAGVRKLCAESSSNLGLGSDRFDDFVEAAEKRRGDLIVELPATLKRLCEKEACDFRYHPPHVQIGCVRLTQIAGGAWSLSVLDDVEIAKVNTVDGEVLFREALARIETTEQALAPKSKLEGVVLKAIQETARQLGRRDSLPVNLVMLLAAQGSSLKRRLSNPEDAAQLVMNRAQFGFLLARVRQSEESRAAVGELKFAGATQVETGSPQGFVPIPILESPRAGANFNPVSRISLGGGVQ